MTAPFGIDPPPKPPAHPDRPWERFSSINDYEEWMDLREREIRMEENRARERLSRLSDIWFGVTVALVVIGFFGAILFAMVYQVIYPQ